MRELMFRAIRSSGLHWLERVTSSTLQSLYSTAKSPSYPLNRRTGGQKCRSGRFADDKICCSSLVAKPAASQFTDWDIQVPMIASNPFSPLNAELNPICYFIILLGDLTFMGTCVVSISNKMKRYTVYLYLETAFVAIIWPHFTYYPRSSSANSHMNFPHWVFLSSNGPIFEDI
jgi:hypothetical protein